MVIEVVIEKIIASYNGTEYIMDPFKLVNEFIHVKNIMKKTNISVKEL